MSEPIKLSRIQRFYLWFFGHVKIGTVYREGWIIPNDLYAFKCPDHGLVSHYPKGYRERLECPHCWTRNKQEMSEKLYDPEDFVKGEIPVKSFAFWFYLFAILSVILVAFYGSLTVASAHSLFLMVLSRQMQTVYRNNIEKGFYEENIKKLNERMDRLDPYTEE